MSVAVVLAEDGGGVNVATKIVQGKVEEGAEKWHRLCHQTGGRGRRGGCGQQGERDVTVVTDDEVCVNVAAPGTRWVA